MERIKALLKDIITEDYQTLEESADCLSYRYEDGSEQETIEINKQVNRYGVTTYTLLVERADFDNEIVKPDACHDCDEGCPYYESDNCLRTDTDVEKDANYWKIAKDIRVRDLTLSTSVVERECHVNVTHTHIYRGFILTYQNAMWKRIEDVLNARDLLFAIYQRITPE